MRAVRARMIRHRRFGLRPWASASETVNKRSDERRQTGRGLPLRPVAVAGPRRTSRHRRLPAAPGRAGSTVHTRPQVHEGTQGRKGRCDREGPDGSPHRQQAILLPPAFSGGHFPHGKRAQYGHRIAVNGQCACSREISVGVYPQWRDGEKPTVSGGSSAFFQQVPSCPPEGVRRSLHASNTAVERALTVCLTAHASKAISAGVVRRRSIPAGQPPDRWFPGHPPGEAHHSVPQPGDR